MKKIVIALIAISIFMSCEAQNIEEVLNKEILQANTPSLQYLFFNKDSIIFHYSKGMMDIKNKINVSEITNYQAFSTTKTFTAVAIMQLVDEGKINLEESIVNLLPFLPYSEEITIKHLLTHSSGIPNPVPLSWIHLEKEHNDFSDTLFVRNVIRNNPKTRFAPNDKFAYSNIEYLILGYLIQEISGISYSEYIEKNIINKIGATSQDLSFAIDTNTLAVGYHNKNSFSNLILGFFLDKKKFMDKAEGKWKPFNHFYMNGYAYSGLIASPIGLAKFAQDLLKKEPTIISGTSKKLMFTENITNSGKRTGMCLSWFTDELSNNTYYAHAGGGGGYYCEIRVYPELGAGSVIMLNRTGMTDDRILNKFDKLFIK